ncbi:UDP-N-acetylglucosamine 2-epimerase (non-hydrolyzing) [Hyphobacterium sp. HN65]|uniref:UDP-N-acetylglucosamine 2-epimerase (non-hydrolyzing) n=1 Tax=Hyphobacterium lacteum TaxID=3116575 RepID=A0ABU7LTQ5_9PROT|nr:UDP-N-acetylglucosamine 2-epimerase (non-hydrolyzing) [Hyphobacterium sp. HN65]MEE2527235.1 UDP-N-acetylglucosamine 2-epimerase (non-hydrolyzing) [Hyphobacterium sp. HN65]
MGIAIVAGTRPEILKLAPVYRSLKTAGLEPVWIATGQHGDLAQQAEESIGIVPDMRLPGGWDPRSLTDLTAGLLGQLGLWISECSPRAVLVQGDTASAYSGALAAHLHRVPVGHVEAGLRSGDPANPFPEESFRRLIAPITDFHFAPTRLAEKNLRLEGIKARRIWITGNPIIDTVLDMAAHTRHPAVLDALKPGERLVLLTAHRRENWGEGISSICSAARQLVERHDDIRIVFPAHSNPRVRETVLAELGEAERIHVTEPLSYPEFIAVLKASHLVLSDSGGVQEEAPSFDVPVLVLRETTERQEAVDAGVARLVGTDPEKIVREASRLLSEKAAHREMADRNNPFGDGQASRRIAEILKAELSPARAGAGAA